MTRTGTADSARKDDTEADRFAGSFSFRTHAILLDIDGTLLDIAATPSGVHVPSSLQGILKTLWKRTGGAVALVSGRPLGDIDRIFDPLRLPAIGGHGAEICPTGKRTQILQRTEPLLEERLRRRLVALARRGIFIEDKGFSIAIHYRLAPELGDLLLKEVGVILAATGGGKYEALTGKAVIEVKPSGFNKGSAVLELMEIAPFRERMPVFVGDDVTDEAVFAILPDVNGVGFSVGRMIPGASAVFDSPADVRAWLEQLAGKTGGK